MTVGEKIIKLRKLTEMSQEDMSDALGIARQTISKWELEETPPRIENLLTICEFFDFPVDDIVDPDLDNFTDEYLNERQIFKERFSSGFYKDKIKLEIEENVENDDNTVNDESIEESVEISQEPVLKENIAINETVAIAETDEIPVIAESCEYKSKNNKKRNLSKYLLIGGAVTALVAALLLFVWAYFGSEVFAQNRTIVNEPSLYVYVEFEDLFYTISAVFAIVFIVMVAVLIIRHIYAKRKQNK